MWFWILSSWKNWTLLKKHLVLNLPPSHLSHCIAVLGRVAVVQTGARAGAGVLEVCPVHPRHSALSNPWWCWFCLSSYWLSVSISLPYWFLSPKMMTLHFTISLSCSLCRFCVRRNPWFNCGEVYTLSVKKICYSRSTNNEVMQHQNWQHCPKPKCSLSVLITTFRH